MRATVKKSIKAVRDVVEDVGRLGMRDWMYTAYKAYGTMVIEDRAIPDYRDGLKPVHRHILWAALSVAKDKYVKGARIVGDTMGRFHPHGDSSIYGGLVTQVNSSMPTFYGQGNWGSPSDNPAAMRYTEAKLSQYAVDYLLHTDYLAVTPMVPNFDGSLQEPLYLPARYPNLLLNGIPSSPAVGVQVQIPAFEMDGLKTICTMLFRGEEVTIKDAKKHLKPKYVYGGHVNLRKSDGFEALWTDGNGALLWEADVDLDTKNREIVINGFNPGRYGMELILERSRTYDFVQRAYDDSDAKCPNLFRYRIQIKKSKGLQEAYDELRVKVLTASVTYNMAVIIRSADDNGNTSGKFKPVGIYTYLKQWCKWRVKLEKDVLAYRISKSQKRLERLNLLLLAQENRALIAKSWEVSDQDAFIQSKLKVSEEDAKYILGFNQRQLGKLDRDDLQAQIKEMEKGINALKKQHSNPVATILETW